MGIFRYAFWSTSKNPNSALLNAPSAVKSLASRRCSLANLVSPEITSSPVSKTTAYVAPPSRSRSFDRMVDLLKAYKETVAESDNEASDAVGSQPRCAGHVETAS